MKNFVLLAILVVLVATLIALPPFTIPAQAFQMPAICEWAGYGPQWLTMCLVQIAFELWIDPIDWLT
jgi:hypothetical protein